MLSAISVVGLGAAAGASADLEPLRAAIDKWSNERDAWAFTVRVSEEDDSGRDRTRVERYDPSRGDAERWTLVSIDERAPTEKEIAAFQRRKGAKRQRATKPPSEYVAFDRVAVVAEDENSIQYAVPLREDISRLIPLEQLIVIITVDRAQCVVRHLAVGLDDPMRIALGLLRVTDLNFDLRFEPAESEPGDDSSSTQPVGVAEASVSAFGDRAEFSWSDFTRVKPAEAPSPVASSSPRERPDGASKQ
jgi:hypothetical protein